MSAIYKGSSISPSNIAFSKYWGKVDDELTLPANSSISMTVDGLFSHTTVEFSESYQEDSVAIGDHDHEPRLVVDSKKTRVVGQLDRMRKLKGIDLKAKVVSKNNFPLGAGIASSASAFSALTAACLNALKIKVDKKQQSILTRLAGSGSATRSVYGGFVLWKKGEESDESYAAQLHPREYWDLSDVVLVLDEDEKKFSSLAGHRAATTSPIFEAKIKQSAKSNKAIIKALEEKNFAALGKVIELEAFILHAAAMTSDPTIFYWTGATVDIMRQVFKLRKQGLEVYLTLDAGPNPHLIVESKNAQKIIKYFKKQPCVKKIYHGTVGEGTRITNQHLF